MLAIGALMAGPGANDVGVGAGGVDDMFGDNVAMIGHDPPFAGGQRV